MNARTDIPLGLLYDIVPSSYFASPGVSNTMLSSLKQSPAHCYALHLDPNRPPEAPPTPAMLQGSLTHCAILEPAELDKRYIAKPPGHDGRTKAGRAWLNEIAEDGSGGLEIVSAEQWATAQAQRSAVLAVPELAHALSSGRAEVTVFWIDERTGLLCRCRIDWLHWLPDGRVIVLDLKTTADASPAEFGRSVWNYGYHRQQEHYTAGLRASGLEVAAFLFAAVTSTYPFIAVPYLLDDDATRRGASEVRDLLDLFAECERAGRWPAYGTGVQVLSLPAWAK